MLQKRLTESVIGTSLENCLIVVSLFYLSVSYYTGTKPKHFAPNGFYNLGLFKVSNVIRQGEILSPYLFIVYIDDTSNVLNSVGIDCHIHNCCSSHVFYADNLCVSEIDSGFAEHLCKVWS